MPLHVDAIVAEGIVPELGERQTAVNVLDDAGRALRDGDRPLPPAPALIQMERSRGEAAATLTTPIHDVNFNKVDA